MDLNHFFVFLFLDWDFLGGAVRSRVLETVLAGEALISTSLFFFWEVVDDNWNDINLTSMLCWLSIISLLCFYTGYSTSLQNKRAWICSLVVWV